MNKEVLPPAIVLGLSPTGLHVARTLGRAGVEVIGVAEGNQAGQMSRYLAGVIEQTSDTQLFNAMSDLARQFEADNKPRAILIPSSDQHVEFITRHANKLQSLFRFQSSYSDGLAQSIMAKDSFYRLCEANGIRYPRVIEAKAGELDSCKDQIDFPWMVKPAEIHKVKREMQGDKGWIIRNQNELDAAISKIPTNAETLLIQEIVPGPESNITLCCTYADKAGAARQMFSARKLRQYPPGFGSASLVQSNLEPESVALTENLLSSAGYHGIAASEFKRHPENGELFIIEINVRPSLWFSVSEVAGRPVVLDAYRDLAGLSALPDRPQRPAVRWRHTIKDLYSKIFYVRHRDFILPSPDINAVGAMKGSTNAVFAMDDWKPAVAEIGFMLQKAISRLTARKSLTDSSGRE